jgi:N-acyl-D-aspartate/D-glutamate deacylase
MAKLILGKPPKHISKELDFPMLDGTVGSIEVNFIYRTRSEYAEFVDKRSAAIKEAAEAELAAMKAKASEQKEEGVSLDLGMPEAEIQGKKSASQADFIMGAVQGWNLDIPFDREAVLQLVDEVPQAAQTIIAAYREAMTEGRLGN